MNIPIMLPIHFEWRGNMLKITVGLYVEWQYFDEMELLHIRRHFKTTKVECWN